MVVPLMMPVSPRSPLIPVVARVATVIAGAKVAPLVRGLTHQDPLGGLSVVEPEHIDGMVRADCDEGALDVARARRDDERAAGGAEGVALVGGAEQADALGAAEVADGEVDVALAGAVEVIDREPLLVEVAAGDAGSAVDRGREGQAVVVRAEHGDRVEVAEAQGGEVDAAAGVIDGQDRVASVAEGVGGQLALIGEGAPPSVETDQPVNLLLLRLLEPESL